MQKASKLDHLIQVGWRVFQSGFDERELGSWRKEALDCVRKVMGPEHPYTQYFSDLVKGDDGRRVMAAAGILHAVSGHIETDAL